MSVCDCACVSLRARFAFRAFFSIYLPTPKAHNLSIYQSVYLSVCLSACLSVSLSVARVSECLAGGLQRNTECLQMTLDPQ